MERLDYQALASYALDPFLKVEAQLHRRLDPQLLHLVKLRASQING